MQGVGVMGRRGGWLGTPTAPPQGLRGRGPHSCAFQAGVEMGGVVSGRVGESGGETEWAWVFRREAGSTLAPGLGWVWGRRRMGARQGIPHHPPQRVHGRAGWCVRLAGWLGSVGVARCGGSVRGAGGGGEGVVVWSGVQCSIMSFSREHLCPSQMKIPCRIPLYPGPSPTRHSPTGFA